MFQVHRDSKDGIVGAAGGISVDRTVWNIIRSHLSKEVENDGNAESEARAGEEGDGVQQIIYVTYQDPDDPSEARTLHIVDDMQADSDAAVSGLYIYKREILAFGVSIIYRGINTSGLEN